MTMLNVLSSTHELEVAILLSGYLALPDQTQQVRCATSALLGYVTYQRLTC